MFVSMKGYFEAPKGTHNDDDDMNGSGTFPKQVLKRALYRSTTHNNNDNI